MYGFSINKYVNTIWTAVMIVGIGILIFTSPNTIINDLISASDKSVKLCISLIAIYAFWLGILKILQKTGLAEKLTKKLSPVIDWLFGKGIDSNTKLQIALNLSSNIMGLGNIATPSAIKAMQGLDDGNGKINNAMTMLVVLNCISLQVFPTTIMGLRASAGSQNPSSVLLPTILSSLLTGIITIFVLKTIFRLGRKKHGK